MIRGTVETDWERLRDLRLRALACDPHAFLLTLEQARELPESHWRDRATPSKTSVTFVDDRDGHFTASVATFIANNPETAYLVGMWVAPEARGSGVAVDLVEHVLDWARGQQQRRVVLSVKAGNERARRLYTECGFVEIPRPDALPYEPEADNHFYAYEL